MDLMQPVKFFMAHAHSLHLEASRLETAAGILSGEIEISATGQVMRRKATRKSKPAKHKRSHSRMSKAGRAAIASAQKARWAKFHKKNGHGKAKGKSGKKSGKKSL
jgi:hypothetical protein